YLEKFIQVVAENSQEPHSVYQGDTGIVAFLEDPGIELQPADFPIDIFVLCLDHLFVQLFRKKQLLVSALGNYRPTVHIEYEMDQACSGQVFNITISPGICKGSKGIVVPKDGHGVQMIVQSLHKTLDTFP